MMVKPLAFRGHGTKLLAFGLWLVLLTTFYWLLRSHDASLVGLVGESLAFVSGSPVGLAIFFGLYLVRPLLLLPVTLLMVAGGFVFGLWLGLFYTLGASLFSAVLAYLIGRYLAGDIALLSLNPSFVARLRERGFETVLIGRFVMLPGDLVSYASGMLGISLKAFALATALGGFPGMLAAVLFGASLEGEFSASGLRINLWTFLLALVVLAVSFLLSGYLRRRAQL